MNKFKLFSLISMISILTVGSVFATFSYATGPLSDKGANINIGLKDWTGQEGIYITSVVLKESHNANTSSYYTKVNSFTSTKLDTKVTLTANADAYVIFTVTFLNNTSTPKMYSSVQYTGTGLSYDNTLIRHDVSNYGLGVASPYTYFTVDLKFSFDTSTTSSRVLNSVINFLFNDFGDGAIANVIEGASADNIYTLSDNNIYYSSNTTYRWTNWVSSGYGVGEPAVMTLIWGEYVDVKTIRLFHFVDANAKNPCEFPENMEISIYNDDTDTYEKFSDYSTYVNYENAKRISGIYNMDIVTTSGKYDINETGVSINNVTFYDRYTGITPATTFEFNSEQRVQAIQIMLDPPATNFVGLVELQVLDSNGNSVFTQSKTS